MGSLSNRQSILRPTSARAAVAQQGLTQHITPRPVSGRFMAAHLGVGRDHAATVDVLHRQLPAPVSAGVAHFYQARVAAERLKQQLAAFDRQRHLTPKEAGYPPPFLSPAQQAQFRADAQAREKQRERETQRLLDEANRNMKALYLPDYLRTSPLVRKRTQVKAKTATGMAPKPRPGAIRALNNGSDCFMPVTFWKSQNPTGKGKWTACAATVYSMLETFYAAGSVEAKATHRYDLVKEHTNSSWSHGYHTRDYYVGAGSSQVTQAMAKLDACMVAHIPVMVGVSHTVNFFLTPKDKMGKITSYQYINNGTVEHFIALVGTGVDKDGKYYRFFDVGTQWKNTGTHKSNRLYLKPSGFYEGTSAVSNYYVLTQLRF